MRPEIMALMEYGPFPAEQMASEDAVRFRQEILQRIGPPISDSEAIALVGLFGPDDFFGLTWTLLHLIESAPGWPIASALPEDGNEWIQRLRERAQRGGRLPTADVR